MARGIDLGSCAVKMVELEKSAKGFRILQAGRRRVARADDADPFAAAAEGVETLDGAGGRPPECTVGFTTRDVNLQFLQLPPVKNHIFRRMIRYELEQKVGGAGDIYAEHAVIGRPSKGVDHFDVVIGLAKKIHVDNTINALRLKGIAVGDALPNALALAEAFRNSGHDQTGMTLLLDIGFEHMELVFLREGKLLFARSVSPGFHACIDSVKRGQGEITDAFAERLVLKKTRLAGGEKVSESSLQITGAVRGALGQMTSVVLSTVSFARIQLKDKELKPQKIYISGGGAKLEGLPRYLTAALGAPVEPFDPFSSVDFSALPEAYGEKVKELPTDLASAIGLAQIGTAGPGREVLSFLPEREKKRRRFFRRTIYLVAAGLLEVAALVLMTVSAMSGIGVEQDRNAQLKKEVDDIRGRTEDFDRIAARQRDLGRLLASVRAESESGPIILDTFVKLTRVLPPRAWISRIRIGGATEEAPGDAAAERVVEIGGFVAEDIEGGPSLVLQRLAAQLTDGSRRISAVVSDMKGSDERKGWREFTITLTSDRSVEQ